MNSRPMHTWCQNNSKSRPHTSCLTSLRFTLSTILPIQIKKLRRPTKSVSHLPLCSAFAKRETVKQVKDQTRTVVPDSSNAIDLSVSRWRQGNKTKNSTIKCDKKADCRKARQARNQMKYMRNISHKRKSASPPPGRT